MSRGFSRQEYAGGGCHFLLQGIFPTQRSNSTSLASPALAGGFFTTEPPRGALRSRTDPGICIFRGALGDPGTGGLLTEM